MKLIEAVSKRTSNLLEAKNYNQYRLCKEGGIPTSSLYNIVKGEKKDIQISTIWAIADTLGISLKEFFDDPVFNMIED